MLTALGACQSTVTVTAPIGPVMFADADGTWLETVGSDGTELTYEGLPAGGSVTFAHLLWQFDPDITFVRLDTVLAVQPGDHLHFPEPWSEQQARGAIEVQSPGLPYPLVSELANTPSRLHTPCWSTSSTGDVVARLPDGQVPSCSPIAENLLVATIGDGTGPAAITFDRSIPPTDDPKDLVQSTPAAWNTDPGRVRATFTTTDPGTSAWVGIRGSARGYDLSAEDHRIVRPVPGEPESFVDVFDASFHDRVAVTLQREHRVAGEPRHELGRAWVLAPPADGTEVEVAVTPEDVPLLIESASMTDEELTYRLSTESCAGATPSIARLELRVGTSFDDRWTLLGPATGALALPELDPAFETWPLEDADHRDLALVAMRGGAKYRDIVAAPTRTADDLLHWVGVDGVRDALCVDTIELDPVAR